MDPYAFEGLVGAGIAASLGAFILWRNRGDAASRAFVLFLGLFGAYGVVVFLGRSGWTAGENLEFYRYGNAVLIPLFAPTLLLFSLRFPRRAAFLDRHRLAAWVPYLPALALILLLLYDIRLFAPGVEVGLHREGDLSLRYGPLLPAFFVVSAAPAAVAVAVWGRAYRGAKSIVERRALRLLAVGFLMTLLGVAAGWVARAAGYSPLGFLDAGEAATILMVTRAILRYKILITPVPEERSEAAPRFQLPMGSSFLVREDRSTAAYEVFRDMVTHGVAGVVVTRTPPEVVRGYGIRKSPIYWLGPQPPAGCTGSLNRVEEIVNATRDFMVSSPGAVLLVDGITYLVNRYEFEAVFWLVTMLKDAAIHSRSIFLLRVDPRVLDPKQMAMLEQELAAWGEEKGG